MAKNPQNTEACKILAAAVSEIKQLGQACLTNASVLIRAHNALVHEPPPCPIDCKWRAGARPQKCNCCARNYKQLNDLYERW